MSTVMLSAKVPGDLFAALRARAIREERTMSAELRRALRFHLQQCDAPADNEGATKADADGPLAEA